MIASIFFIVCAPFPERYRVAFNKRAKRATASIRGYPYAQPPRLPVGRAEDCRIASYLGTSDAVASPQSPFRKARMIRTSPHAILLCAGLGSRLLPLTADRPKCLIEVGGRTILEHQVEALRAAGVGGVTIVGGYRFDRLAAFVTDRWNAAERPELVLNPFYAISSSIGSVWAARHRLDAPFCLLNGDTIYDPALVADGLARLGPGINLFVEPADVPELDDMLVRIDGGRVIAVGKDLPATLARHRSLGFIASAEPDGGGYACALEKVIREVDGVQSFHHAVIDRLAHEGRAHAVPFADGVWTEIDRPEDIARWSGNTQPSIAAGDRAVLP
jgi:choline kinase